MVAEPVLSVEAMDGVMESWRRAVRLGVLLKVLAAAATAAKPDGVPMCSFVLLGAAGGGEYRGFGA